MEVESPESSARAVEQSEQSQQFPQRTFCELARAWLSVEARRLVEPRNERRHIDHLKSLWSLGEAELTPREARRALLRLLQPKGPLSAATVNKVHGTARRIIRDAQVNGEWRGLNPFELVPRLKQVEPYYYSLSLEEVRAILPRLRRDRSREARVMVVLGPRPGELKALQKCDVDVRAHTILWRRSNARDSTKTGKVRLVPVPDSLWPVIVDAMELSPSELVFPREDGQRQAPHLNLGRTLREAMSTAGIVVGYRFTCRSRGCGYKLEVPTPQVRWCPKCSRKLNRRGLSPRVRWYDLRHAAATLHRLAGCDPLVIQLALGHAVKGTTDRIYTHLPLEHMRAELSKLVL